MTEPGSSIKVIHFSGKKTDWAVWSEKFLARAKMRGYRDILPGKEIIPKDNEEPEDSATDAVKEKYKKVRDSNELAYLDLVLCIEGNTQVGCVAFACVKGSKTQDITMGDSRVAWTRLTNKFAPKTAPSRLHLRALFNASSLKPKQHPDEWLTYLEDLRDQLIEANSEMTEESLLEHALNRVTPEYKLQVSLLERD